MFLHFVYKTWGTPLLTSSMIIIIFISSWNLFLTLYFLGQYPGWCFIDVLYTSEGEQWMATTQHAMIFTFSSTELLNWLLFLQQNSCTHTDKELKQDEKWPRPKLSSCYIEVLWCCFLRSSGMHLASPEISVKFPSLKGSHYLPYISTFHRVGTS